MIRFETISICNFLSIGSVQLDLRRQGFVLVLGEFVGEDERSNGSGKSALFDAILYALYGQTLRSQGRYDDVVHNLVDKDLSVVLEFVKDGSRYRVERYRKHEVHKNAVRLFRDEGEITCSLTSETDREIERVIGVSFELFCSIVIIGRGFPFAFAKCTESKRMEILEQFAGSEVFDRAYGAVSVELTSLQKEMEKLEQGVERTASEEQRLRALLSLEIARLADEEAKRVETLRCLNERLAGFTAEEARLGVSLVDGQGTVNRLSMEVQDRSAEVSRLDGEIRRVGRLVQEAGIGGQAIAAAVTRLQALGRSCPTCYQEVPLAHVERILAEQQTLLARAQKEEDRLSVDLHPLGVQFAEVQVVLEQARSSFEAARAQVKADARLLDGIRNAKEGLERAAAVPPPSTTTPEIQARLEQLKKSLSGMQERLGVLREELPYLEFWHEGFSARGIRSYRMDRILAWLNDRLSLYAGMILGDRSAIQLLPVRQMKKGDTKNAVTMSVGLCGGKYGLLSSGQERVVDLCVHFALRDLAQTVANFETNLLICDEILDPIDPYYREEVVELLRQWATDRGVYLLTHDSGLKGFIPDVLRVQWREGFTYLVQEEDDYADVESKVA